MPYEVDSLDPHLSNTVSNYVIAAHFYEPLVRISGNMTVEPVLAESWENPDASSWVFHLRHSVHFHDAKTFNAADVVYTFKRLQDDQSLEMREYLQNIGQVTALDSYTVMIRTIKPVAILLNRLNFILIVPSGSGNRDLNRGINGTGPYRFSSRDANQITLIRNEQYWGTKPTFPKVTFLLGRSAEQAEEDLLSGKSQFAQCNTRKLNPAALPQFKIVRRDSLFMKYLSFDLARDKTPYSSIQPNPFKNPIVRQAISLAINRNKLADQLSTFAVPASQPVPAFVFGFAPDLPPPVYDPEKARSLLKQARIEDWHLTLHARKLLEESGNLVKGQLENVGIHVDLQPIPDHEFFQRMGRRDTSFFLSRLGCPTGDASNVLDIAFHSLDRNRNYGTYNIGGYQDPVVDEYIEKSDENLATESRRKQLQDVISKVTQDYVWIPLYLDQDTYAFSKDFLWEPRFDSYIFASEMKWAK